MKISFVGSGNVATHLAKAFYHAGFNIFEICSPTLEHAKLLAEKVEASYLENVSELKETDLLVISAKDDEIINIVNLIQTNVGCIVHTSGATNINVFKNKFENYGVLYPLQTFSKNTDLDFSTVPLCIEGSNSLIESQLIEIGNKLSGSVQVIDSLKRKQIHLAAVFVCNFVNHLFAIGDNLLKESHISFDILMPLIDETVRKIKMDNPLKVQTGPAVRDDKKVMANHLELLNDMPEFQEIYKLLSSSIKNMHS